MLRSGGPAPAVPEFAADEMLRPGAPRSRAETPLKPRASAPFPRPRPCHWRRIGAGCIRAANLILRLQRRLGRSQSRLSPFYCKSWREARHKGRYYRTSKYFRAVANFPAHFNLFILLLPHLILKQGMFRALTFRIATAFHVLRFPFARLRFHGS